LLLRLVEARRKLVNKRVRLTNELTQVLKEYFPQALQWAGGLDGWMACAFLTKWPTLQKLQKSKPEVVRRFYRDHRCRSSEQIDQRIAEIRSACCLTWDRAVIESSVMMVRALVAQLRVLIEAIDHFDEEIATIYHRLPDAEIFSSFPGAGPFWDLGSRLPWEPIGLASMTPSRSRNTRDCSGDRAERQNQSGSPPLGMLQVCQTELP